MADRRREPRNFDRDKPLVAVRGMTVFGEQVVAGDPIPDTLSLTQRIRFWTLGRVDYEDDYKARSEKFAPPMTAQDVADAKAQQAVDAGAVDQALVAPDAPLDYTSLSGSNVVMEETGGGWYEITLEDGETEKVRGKDNAEARLRELRETPEGE